MSPEITTMNLIFVFDSSPYLHDLIQGVASGTGETHISCSSVAKSSPRYCALTVLLRSAATTHPAILIHILYRSRAEENEHRVLHKRLVLRLQGNKLSLHRSGCHRASRGEFADKSAHSHGRQQQNTRPCAAAESRPRLKQFWGILTLSCSSLPIFQEQGRLACSNLHHKNCRPGRQTIDLCCIEPRDLSDHRPP